MKTFKQIRQINEKFKLPKPPFKDMVLVGFSGKFKMAQSATDEANYGKQVVDDFKKAQKITDTYLKKLKLKPVPKIYVGPKDTASKNKIKVGDFDMNFAIDLFLDFPNNVQLPKGSQLGEFDLGPLVAQLGKLKSFANYPQSDFSANWDDKV
jgi:hypothetical protein